MVWRKVMNFRLMVMSWMPLVATVVLIYIVIYFRLFG